MIRANIESWRVPLLKSLVSTLEKTIGTLSKDKYTIDFVTSALENSFAWKDLQSEVNSLLNFYAWQIQIWYFAKVQTASRSNVPLRDIDFNCSQAMPSEFQFFVEDRIEQILEEFEKQTNDEGYESDSSDTINDIFTEGVQYDHWKDLFTAVCTNLMKHAIDSTFIEPTISVILSYIANSGDSNMPPSEAQLSFIQEDKNLKQALTEYKSSNQSKSRTQFLITELHSIIHKVINSSHLDQSKTILRIAVKYGYPLPLSAAKIVATAIDNFLTKFAIYTAGVFLKITDDEKRILVQFQTKNGKAKMIMRHIGGVIFVCRSDYHAYAGISEQTTEEVGNAFFYEALIGFLKHLHWAFPRQAETLREGILDEL